MTRLARAAALAALALLPHIAGAAHAEVLQCAREGQTRYRSGVAEIVSAPTPDVFVFDTQTGRFSQKGLKGHEDTVIWFQIISKNSPLFVNAVNQFCIEELCVGQFLAIAMPGQLPVILGREVPRLVRQLAFMLVEGNGPAMMTGNCRQLP